MSISSITKGILSPAKTTLFRYTACDIADVLLKLDVPNAGYLPNIRPITANNTTSGNKDAPNITIAPASTMIFGSNINSEIETSTCHLKNIPTDTHWIDLTPPDTILVVSQPEGQSCAVLGGILALRAKVLGAKGVVVSGRVRDVLELNSIGLPIWAKGTSIVGSAAESRPLATQVTLNINATIVTPGDLVFCDSINGVVVIPQERVTEVVNMLPTLTEADERIKKEVMSGVSVFDAFAKNRQ